MMWWAEGAALARRGGASGLFPCWRATWGLEGSAVAVLVSGAGPGGRSGTGTIRNPTPGRTEAHFWLELTKERLKSFHKPEFGKRLRLGFIPHFWLGVTEEAPSRPSFRQTRRQTRQHLATFSGDAEPDQFL